MPKKSRIAVLVSIEDRTLAARLRHALGETSWCEVLTVQTLCREAKHPDVIVIDDNSSKRLTTAQRQRIARGATSIIAIGCDDSLGMAREPQVRLPADTPPQEVVWACRLAAETARLRRRVRRLTNRLRKGNRQRQRLSQLASSDPLTALPNRRAWHRELQSRLSERSVDGARECLALVDLDRFKEINDTQGYAAGDRLLQAAGNYLRNAVRALDFVARLGGDEFGLLLGDIDEHSAASIIERVRVQVRDQIQLEAPNVGVSIGYIVYEPQRGLDDADLASAADRALREAKTAGRDRSAASAGVAPRRERDEHKTLPLVGGRVEHKSA